MTEVQHFAGFKFNDQWTWVILHNEDLHFSDNTRPQIKLCGSSLRVKANKEFVKLPDNVKEALCAHELGHLEYQHYLVAANPFFRMGEVMKDKVAEREAQADSYAVKLIGKDKYIQALKDYIRTASPVGLAKKEIELRIRRL